MLHLGRLPSSMCEHKVSAYIMRLRSSLASQNQTVFTLLLILLNPANSNVRLQSARAEQLRKQDYSLWQHLEAARVRWRER